MLLDFKEIPKANSGDGLQDTFELFSRDFFELLGYEIIQHPDRGADGKKDLIVQETRTGISGVSHLRWLVSCKHFAHSGKSVSDTDEPNILDRVSVHQCDGFIGFYSTLPATSLGANLTALKGRIHIQCFDREMIEKALLENSKGQRLASRYFPVSFERYKVENPQPADIFDDPLTIKCEHCEKDLLASRSGILVLLRPMPPKGTRRRYEKRYVNAYFACKGVCDRALKNMYFQNGVLLDEWTDIPNFLSPTGYIRKVMAYFNSINSRNEKFEPEAFDKIKEVFVNAFPFVSRQQTSAELAKVKFYLENGIQDFL